MCALVGACGSGKSTLLGALAGEFSHTGKLEVKGSIGLVFQNPRLQFLALTVSEEVLVTLHAAEPDAAEDELSARVPGLLAEFGLDGLAERSPYEISQGQQRRLAMLSMLADSADVLLLDEPTYAQDERSTCRMLDVLMERVAAGLTVVVATHDLALARVIANQVLLVGGWACAAAGVQGAAPGARHRLCRGAQRGHRGCARAGAIGSSRACQLGGDRFCTHGKLRRHPSRAGCPRDAARSQGCAADAANLGQC